MTTELFLRDVQEICAPALSAPKAAALFAPPDNGHDEDGREQKGRNYEAHDKGRGRNPGRAWRNTHAAMVFLGMRNPTLVAPVRKGGRFHGAATRRGKVA